MLTENTISCRDWAALSKGEIDAPWKPFVRPLPKSAKAISPVTEGRGYDATNDPFPQFTYNSAHVQHATAKDTADEQASGNGSPPIAALFEKVFSFGLFKKTSTTSGSSLRPLLLPQRVARRASQIQVPAGAVLPSVVSSSVVVENSAAHLQPTSPSSDQGNEKSAIMFTSSIHTSTPVVEIPPPDVATPVDLARPQSPVLRAVFEDWDDGGDVPIHSPRKGSQELLERVKWWVRKLWVPKVRCGKGGRVDLLV